MSRVKGPCALPTQRKFLRLEIGHPRCETGIQKEVCLAYLPEIEVGDYTIIHVGFAISLLSEQEAQETLQLLREIANVEEELGIEPAELEKQ